MKTSSFLLNLRKYELFLIFFVLIISEILLSVYFLMPLIEKKKEAERTLKAESAKENTLRNKSGLINAPESDRLSESLSVVLSMMPLNNDYVNLLLRLDDLQKKTGVLINNADIQLGSVSTASAMFKKEGRLSSVPLSLEVTGTADQVREFLTMLSDFSGRFISAKDLTVNVKNGDYKSKLSAETYYAVIPPSSLSYVSPSLEVVSLLDQISTASPAVQEIPEQQEEGIVTGKNNLFE